MDAKKQTRTRRIRLAAVILLNLVMWIIPSNVVEQIARDHHTLLGRYSRTHFTWNIVIALVSAVAVYLGSSSGKAYRRRWFQVIAVLGVTIPALGVFDYVLRRPHYVRDSFAYHHPVDSEFHLDFVDRPEAARTYPVAPPGYGVVSCTLRTDGRGFRNQTRRDRYDVVVLGDSFAEGSKVSDKQTWPARLATQTGLSVYNLGMSGYDPSTYLFSLKEYGLALKPRFVICLLYEGNDFRSAKADRKRKAPSLSKRFRRYVKQSPILNGLDRWMVDTLGPIHSRGPVRGADILDWLPLRIPDGPRARYYTFKPKQLRDAYESREAFARDRHWINPRRQLAEMKEACEAANCRLIMAYAPTSAHVLLPLAADHLPADKVRAFLALRYRHELPEAKTFLTTLLERLDARESVVRDWCRRESIPFITLTETLRQRTASGRQVYYTYDQHWTPDGHAVVADVVSRFLTAHFPATESQTNSGP